MMLLALLLLLLLRSPRLPTTSGPLPAPVGQAATPSRAAAVRLPASLLTESPRFGRVAPHQGGSARAGCEQGPTQPVASHPAPELPRQLKLGVVTLPVVFYVHNRPEYFEQAADALVAAAGSADTLILISHDGLYPEMDAAVRRLAGRLGRDHAGVFQLVHPQCGQGDKPERWHDGDKVLKVKAHWWWMMEQVWRLLPDAYRGPVVRPRPAPFCLVERL